jgi:hypothetical protein
LKGLSSSEIPLNKLEIGSEIGSRTYGRVCEMEEEQISSCMEIF